MDEAKDRSPQLGPNEHRVQVLGRTHVVRFDGSGSVWIDGIAFEATLQESENGILHLRMGASNYRLWEGGGPSESGEFDLFVNGYAVHGTIDDRRSSLRRRSIGPAAGANGSILVKAPMPGLVTKILVKAGMRVEKGQGVIVLEAMKMENELKAEMTGVVQEIMTSERMPVEKGQVLLKVITA